ncbi:MAG TPA: sulfurtransferase [Bacillales bacterium]|nr:sulfurtransferase [Bacillales bacterium]
MSDLLISAKTLADHLDDENTVIVDCRFQLNDPEAGRNAYEQDHIPGAVYFDLDKDMSGPVREHGGRHPLPNPKEFVKKLEMAGIDANVRVVAYDDENGAFAARFWWMLNYFGHENGFVLDVGYSTWKKEGYPTSSEIPYPKPAVFKANVRREMAVGIEEVKQRQQEDEVVLIDSRAPARYRGEHEPIDRKAGHIPGAVNRFWKENIGPDGKWKPIAQLRERFTDDDAKEYIVYCGSGVTAAANALALQAVGKKVRLYVGSWSDWSSYDENPVETGE